MKQIEAANRDITMWAWKRAGDAGEGSTGLTSNRADVSLGTVPTDSSKYTKGESRATQSWGCRAAWCTSWSWGWQRGCPRLWELSLSTAVKEQMAQHPGMCKHHLWARANKSTQTSSKAGKDCSLDCQRTPLSLRGREMMLGGNSSVAVGDSLLWEGLHLLIWFRSCVLLLWTSDYCPCYFSWLTLW